MYIGIDVGGTNLRAGLVDEKGTLLTVWKTPLGKFQGEEAFAAALAELSKKTMAQAGVSPEAVEYVGMGIPGAVSRDTIFYTCNIPIQNVPIARLFRKNLDLPVLLGNDADCAAVGEYFCGAGKDTRDFIVITLGTGVGGGMILRGKLFTGSGMAGEVGHMVIEQGGVPCNCGRRGCWEAYASATGLIRLTRESMEKHPESAMHAVARKYGAVDGRTSFEAAGQGDAAAQEVCDRYTTYLAAGLTNLVNILEPDKIALGGGVAGASDALLLEPLRRKVEAECYGRHCGKYTQIVRAELGNDAGMIGAALLGRAI